VIGQRVSNGKPIRGKGSNRNREISKKTVQIGSQIQATGILKE